MQPWISTAFVAIVGAIATLGVSARMRRWEGTVLLASFAAHVLSGVVQVFLTRWLWGHGDIFGYAYRARQITSALEIDFAASAPELVRLLFQQAPLLPVDIRHPESPTGSMTALSGMLAFVVGNDPVPLCVAAAVIAFFGKVALYRMLVENLDERLHTTAAVSTLLVPSVVFWSSALLKESWAMAGLGWLALGAHRLASRRFASGIGLTVLGGALVALIKPYILFAFVPAVGAWLWWRAANARGHFEIRPLYILLGGLVAIGGMAALGQIFPQYALENLAEEAALNQETGERMRGGSTYQLVDPSARDLPSQLLFAPLALLTSLFRPLLIESSSPQVAVNALETTVLLLLFLRALARTTPLVFWAQLRRHPILVLCIVFSTIFGTAVGLGTTNLGTLSRYRMPLVPFFALVLAVYALERPGERAAPSQPPLRRPSQADRRTAASTGTAASIE